MRSNVKTIKLTTWLSLILIAITYLISIKRICGGNELKWLPDSFLLAVFGGAFASMLVVLICEISKYYQNRESTETYLVSHLYYLYGQLQVISKNIGFFIEQKDRMPQNSLIQLIANVEAEMNAIYFADYAPYKKNNAILTEKMEYNNGIFPVIQQFMQDCRLIEIAAITDEMIRIKKSMGTDEGTENNVSLVLLKLSEQVQEPLSLINKLLTRIDQICHGRYNWSKRRDDLVKGIPDNRTDMLELFLQKK